MTLSSEDTRTDNTLITTSYHPTSRTENTVRVLVVLFMPRGTRFGSHVQASSSVRAKVAHHRKHLEGEGHRDWVVGRRINDDSVDGVDADDVDGRLEDMLLFPGVFHQLLDPEEVLAEGHTRVGRIGAEKTQELRVLDATNLDQALVLREPSLATGPLGCSVGVVDELFQGRPAISVDCRVDPSLVSSEIRSNQVGESVLDTEELRALTGNLITDCGRNRKPGL
jgi:hypothetical protein